MLGWNVGVGVLVSPLVHVVFPCHPEVVRILDLLHCVNVAEGSLPDEDRVPGGGEADGDGTGLAAKGKLGGRHKRLGEGWV